MVEEVNLLLNIPILLWSISQVSHAADIWSYQSQNCEVGIYKYNRFKRLKFVSYAQRWLRKIAKDYAYIFPHWQQVNRNTWH